MRVRLLCLVWLVVGPALLLLPSVGLRVWPPAARPGCCAVVLVSGDAGILLEAGPSVDGLAQAIDWYHFSFQVYVLHQLCQLGLCGQLLQKSGFQTLSLRRAPPLSTIY